MEFTCEQIGLNQDELQERIVDSISERMLSRYVTYSDEHGDVGDIENTAMKAKLDKVLRDRIDAEVERVANAHLQPITADLIRNYQIQETNKWGEATGKKMTFTEFLAERAGAYMAEPVDFSGETKDKKGYGWKQRSTRLVYEIEKHLHHHIEAAMKSAIGNAHKTLNEAILSTVKASLAEVGSKIKTSVTIK